MDNIQMVHSQWFAEITVTVWKSVHVRACVHVCFMHVFMEARTQSLANEFSPGPAEIIN